jgi:hypothetical protein
MKSKQIFLGKFGQNLDIVRKQLMGGISWRKFQNF